MPNKRCILKNNGAICSHNACNSYNSILYWNNIFNLPAFCALCMEYPIRSFSIAFTYFFRQTHRQVCIIVGGIDDKILTVYLQSTYAVNQMNVIESIKLLTGCSVGGSVQTTEMINFDHKCPIAKTFHAKSTTKTSDIQMVRKHVENGLEIVRCNQKHPADLKQF